MLVLSKAVYSFSAICPNSNDFFFKIRKIYPEFIWKFKGPWIAKTILEKNKARVCIPPGFETYCRAAVIRAARFQQSEGRKLSGTERHLRINAHTCSHGLSTRVPGPFSGRQNNCLSKCVGKTGYPVQNMKLNPYLTPHSDIYAK